MSVIRRIHAAPGNLATYIQDILPAYARVYGPEAARQYQANAPRDLSLTMAHPAIRCYAVVDGPDARALLFARKSATRFLLSFFHELQAGYDSSESEALLRFVVADLARTENIPIQSEYLAFSPSNLDETYRVLGFEQVGRALQQCTLLPEETAVHSGVRIAPLGEKGESDGARVLTEAYARHPEKRLFEEVTTLEAACTFIAQTQAGAFGNSPSAYHLGAWVNGACVGLALGSEVVAGLGFVLHMAVLPEFQGQGIGRQLLSELKQGFRQAGLERVALGVTNTNPARYLYESAGFETVQPFPVYYRFPQA